MTTTYTAEEIESRRAEMRTKQTAADLAEFIEDTLCGVDNTDPSALDHACIAELLREAAALHDEKAVENGGAALVSSLQRTPELAAVQVFLRELARRINANPGEAPSLAAFERARKRIDAFTAAAEELESLAASVAPG